MNSKLVPLFEGICTIIFYFADGTSLRVTTTLNPDILTSYGAQHLDGIVDLDTLKIIPDNYFDLTFEIIPGIVALTSELDTLLNNGGKVAW